MTDHQKSAAEIVDDLVQELQARNTPTTAPLEINFGCIKIEGKQSSGKSHKKKKKKRSSSSSKHKHKHKRHKRSKDRKYPYNSNNNNSGNAIDEPSKGSGKSHSSSDEENVEWIEAESENNTVNCIDKLSDENSQAATCFPDTIAEPKTDCSNHIPTLLTPNSDDNKMCGTVCAGDSAECEQPVNSSQNNFNSDLWTRCNSDDNISVNNGSTNDLPAAAQMSNCISDLSDGELCDSNDNKPSNDDHQKCNGDSTVLKEKSTKVHKLDLNDINFGIKEIIAHDRLELSRKKIVVNKQEILDQNLEEDLNDLRNVENIDSSQCENCSLKNKSKSKSKSEGSKSKMKERESRKLDSKQNQSSKSHKHKSGRSRSRSSSQTRSHHKSSSSSHSHNSEKKSSISSAVTKSSSKHEKSKHSSRRSRSRSPRSKRSYRTDRSQRSHEHELEQEPRSKSKSRSPNPKRKRSHHSNDEKIDKVKLLEIARRNALAMYAEGKIPASLMSEKEKLEPLVPTTKPITKSVQELTAFCKHLSSMEGIDDHRGDANKGDNGSDEDDGMPFIQHPFKLRETKPICFIGRSLTPLQPKPPKPAEVVDPSNLRLQFPVSSGCQHRDKQGAVEPLPEKLLPDFEPVIKPVKPVEEPPKAKPVKPAKSEFKEFIPENKPPSPSIDIGSIVSERLKAVRRLQENPHDIEALCQINKAQQQAQNWAQSKQLPGQFTGSTGVRMLTPEELAGPKHVQAWVKKDQFNRAAPIAGGIGMNLLRKMGWQFGCGLGKNNDGCTEPLMLEIKTDKKGLVSHDEMSHKAKLPTQVDCPGKHPVSVLMELCNRHHWSKPDFILVHDSGPDHKKNFLFKVAVNGQDFQPAVASPSKKHAKAQAATVALQGMGLLHLISSADAQAVNSGQIPGVIIQTNSFTQPQTLGNWGSSTFL